MTIDVAKNDLSNNLKQLCSISEQSHKQKLWKFKNGLIVLFDWQVCEGTQAFLKEIVMLNINLMSLKSIRDFIVIKDSAK
jgi:hypothetical protein